MSTDDTEAQRSEIGRRLRDSREYLNFSQDEVATALGLSRPSVTNMEAGSRKVDALELSKLSRLYGRSVNYLLTGDDEFKTNEKVAFAARALQGLSGRDLEEVMRFANYLRNSARPGARKGK